MDQLPQKVRAISSVGTVSSRVIRGLFFHYLTADQIFLLRGAVIVGPKRVFIFQVVLPLLQVLLNFPADLIRQVFSKIGKGLLSGFRHHIAGAVALLFFLDQPAVQQFVDGLLDVEIRGVVVVQKKAGDLCVGEGEIHPLQHIENDHFIQCGCLFNHE